MQQESAAQGGLASAVEHSSPGIPSTPLSDESNGDGNTPERINLEKTGTAKKAGVYISYSRERDDANPWLVLARADLYTRKRSNLPPDL